MIGSSTPYQPPVSQLLKLPEIAAEGNWETYASTYGICAVHITELLRMAGDAALHNDENPAHNQAPTHAWRALSQLGHPEVAEPLLDMLCQSRLGEYAYFEIPEVVARLGGETIPYIRRIFDRCNRAHRSAASLLWCYRELYKADPKMRVNCAQALLGLLMEEAKNDRIFNGLIIRDLCALSYVEAQETALSCYQRGLVDQTVFSMEDCVAALKQAKAP
jgi:hypothetical protein